MGLSGDDGVRPLTGRVALVTGASSGIGAAIASALAAEGAKVACVARHSQPLLRKVTEINEAGGHASAHSCDVTVWSEMVCSVDEIEALHGPLSIAFLNAGGNLYQASVVEVDPDAWRAAIDLNMTSVLLGLRSVLPSMRRAGGGRIIFTGSAMAQYPQAGHSSYCAAKAGARMIMRTAALELADEGITINELVPGPVRTQQALSEGKGEDPGSPFNNPLEWVKSAEDVVPLALMLASHPGKGPTGQVFSLARR